MFAKIARIFILTMFLAGMIALPAAAATTYTISGTVTLNGVGLKGVSVKVSGTVYKATTSSTGAYSILSIPAALSGTVVASYPNYSFSPATGYAFANLASNLVGKNFTATLTNFSKYSISGLVTLNGVGLANVAVTFSTFSAVTNSTGAYTISNVPAATTGRIVPKLSGYIFTPAYISVTNISANLTGKNFTAAAASTVPFSISGTVTFNGAGLANVTVKFLTYSALTSSTGAYTITGIPSGSTGRITPSLSGYSFTPSYISVTSISSNLTGKNFTAAIALTIGGKVTDQSTTLPLSGVLVTCGTHSATTGSTGTYTIRNLAVGTSCTLTPSLSGKTFSPATISVSNMQTSLHSQNFVAIP